MGYPLVYTMKTKISVVINTLNEEKNIVRAIKSVEWADEIVVIDMYSEDNTANIAKNAGAKVFFHKKMGYVEPARNFAISKAKNDWVLIVDADEEVPSSLAEKLQNLIDESEPAAYVSLPRKNMIFGKWIKESMWWPDYNIRFFNRNNVSWNDKIHSKPQTKGKELLLDPDEKYALVHHHYTSISQFIQRMDRYTNFQAKDLLDEGYKFVWVDVLKKPLSEFLSRFFAHQGYKDGLHGLILALLQGFSFLIVYLKVWEQKEFPQQDLHLKQLYDESKDLGKEINYWFKHETLPKNALLRLGKKVINKID